MKQALVVAVVLVVLVKMDLLDYLLLLNRVEMLVRVFLAQLLV